MNQVDVGKIIKEARINKQMTQQQLAEKIGKKREYIAMLEKGETDMQLSTFILISEAVGLKFALTYQRDYFKERKNSNKVLIF